MMAVLLGILSSHKSYDEEHTYMVNSHKRTMCEQVAGKDISCGRQCDVMKRHWL